MAKIRVLPETLSNKIAAGEVVERPASVVKELIENSLDAQSTRIIVEVEKGGQSLIQVSDNGVGMATDDALLALERYATSKIKTADDLFAIKTLGFRGEALPSIAAVTQLSLITREKSADTGTEISVEGGKVKNVGEVGAPPGTLIAVKQLFFNTPVRKKFLKTISTEMSHIADTVSRIALCHPGVQFRLINNNKVVKNWPPVSRHQDRIVDVLGTDAAGNLHAIALERNGLAVAGWICSPRVTRRTPRGLYIFVNGRFVRDRSIQHGVFAGFAQRLVKGQFPIAVIFLKVPFDQVDVNVHPTKNEVRFANPQHIHEAVKSAVAQALYEVDRVNWRPTNEHPRPESQHASKVAEPPTTFTSPGSVTKSSRQTQFSDPQRTLRQPVTDDWQPASTSHQPPASSQQPAASGQRLQDQIFDNRGFSSLRVVGQLHNTYILCESEAGLVLIDQHAAHERIYFEQLQRSHKDHPSAVQKLLVPETLELNFREAQILGQMVADLNSLGLEIEPFGKNTFAIKAVPALLSGRDVKPLIAEIVETAAQEGYSPGLKGALDQCRMVMACHGALRAHQALSDDQIRQLLTRLDECENPSHCPHGRPTWIRWDLAMLEKSFKRIV